MTQPPLLPPPTPTLADNTLCEACGRVTAIGTVAGSNQSAPDLPPFRTCAGCAERRGWPVDVWML